MTRATKEMLESKVRATARCINEYLYRRAFFLLPLCLLGLALPFLTSQLSGTTNRIVWALDLVVHWQWLFAIGAAGSCVIVGVRRKIFSYLLVVVLALPFFSAANAWPETSRGVRPTLTIASANINIDNSDVHPLAEWLAEASPDVVAVLEVSPAYAAGLAKLSAYPHQVAAPALDPFGIALLSKHPLSDTRVVRDGSSTPYITARLQVHGKEVRVVAFHPMPPFYVADHRERDTKLQQLISESDIPAVIAGDFNATPWSTAFAAIENSGWLRATGLAPTWPSSGRGYIGIPIDHVIASPHWVSIPVDRRPNIGSDHLPVIVGLLLVK